MGRFKWPFKRIFRFRTLGLIAGCIGCGMLMVLVFPIWIWILIVAISLIVWACKEFFI